jgi:nitrogen fixation protein NifU and related proteins
MTDNTSEAKQLIESGFSKSAVELYENKINIGVIENQDADAVFLGPSGDLIRLYLKFQNEIVEEAKFLCYGHPSSAVAMSALTILIKGKRLSEVKKMTEKDIIKAIGGLPETKQDCALLSIKTLQKVIAQYEKINGNSNL